MDIYGVCGTLPLVITGIKPEPKYIINSFSQIILFPPSHCFHPYLGLHNFNLKYSLKYLLSS